jgi:hypothetical protein
MDADKLDELERLLKAGTDGPWAVHPDGSVVAFTEQPLNFVVCSRIFPTDAALIVAAINALPELVARVRELRKALEVIGVEADLLKLAIKEDDPTNELLLRVKLIEEAIARAALKGPTT